MTPLRLELCNFMAHRDTAIDYAGARLSVFVGENGAGKSAASSEALEFALYGKSRLSPDDLVTWGETDMTVTLTFDHAGGLYRIVRGRSLRSGGKSFLELHLWDPDQPAAARPLTGATIAETQAAIERLLGMDHATFRSSVLLKQQDLARFAKATAGERKRILGQVLGLELYERAEARTREQARDVDRGMAQRKADVDMLAEQIAGRDQLETSLAHWTSRVASIEDEVATAEGNRANHERRLREIATEQASTTAAQADVARLTAEIADLMGRWRDAQARQARAAAAVARLTATGATSRPDVASEAAEARLAQARAAHTEARRLFEEEETKHRVTVAELDSKRAGLVHTVAEFEAAVAGLVEVVCRKCGERQPADPADLAGRLHTARQALLGLPEPTESLRVGTLRGQAARRESDVREAEKALAGAQLAEAEADVAAAAKDKATVEEAGKRAREQLAAAQAQLVNQPDLVGERKRLEEQLGGLEFTIKQLARDRVDAATSRGRAEQALEDVGRAEARHAALTAALATDTVELGRLRKLTTAFGANGIPARIVESVLPEFAAEANEILAETLPGWGVDLRAQRARKSGDGMVEALDLIVLLDGLPRPFEAASGGQQTVIVLALALALSRLAGRRSGATIRYFGVDEPDGLDVVRRAMFGQALRTLAHRGDLELISLVTHNEDLAEYGDRVHRVHANSQGSVVELVG